MSSPAATPVKIEIETAIRRQSWATAQVGQKSLQTILVDFAAKTVKEKHVTGHTTILGKDFNSIRDNFSCKASFAASGNVTIEANGQTASAVGFMPSINYALKILLTQSPKTITVTGTHDGYPSYNVALNGTSVYDYVQGHLGQLFGESDVTVSILRKTVSW